MKMILSHRAWIIGSVLLAATGSVSPCMGQELRVLQAAKKCVPAVRVAQGKILPNAKCVPGFVPPQQEKLKALLQQKITQSQFRDLPFRGGLATDAADRAGFVLYQRAMDQFKKLQKELNPVLYYQSNGQEKRALLPQEKKYWSERISKVNHTLNQVERFILPTDPALKGARAYMQEASRFLFPELGNLPQKKPALRTDREFVLEEFFLHSPAKYSVTGLKRRLYPDRFVPPLHVVVLNDRWSLYKSILAAHRDGSFMPKGKVSVYTSPDNFLRAVKQGDLKPDFVLTDLLLPEHSGYLVVQELREAGYNGPIVALSAYEEEALVGREMFEYGLDGLISEPEGFEYVSSWPRRIHRKIANYYYYKQLHNWPH